MTALDGSVLIANRGEIAVRIARTLRRLGIRSVVTAHALDLASPAAQQCDAVLELEGDDPIAAYLDSAQIVEKAQAQGVQAIHPGYGFLAENADFAEATVAAGLVFVGPPPEVTRLMGDKIQARAFVAERGFTLGPSVVESDAPADFEARARTLGFPLLVKASAGGGGKGMHAVREPGALAAAIERARAEALRYFGDGRLYAEPLIERPRHVEVQVLADQHGRCLHLFERDCSLQRRFQKVVEECPAPGLDPELRDQLHREAVGIASAAGYVGAGTVEFILGPTGSFSFLEMNTRLQVEHPVTEAVTGLDLVEQQLRIAAGEPLAFAQDELALRGHAIETRICAEVPHEDWRPATGTLHLVREPSGEGIRLDSGVASGSQVSASFDPMLAKLIAHGVDREQAILRARQGLADTVLLGVATNAGHLRRILSHPAFARGDVHTGFLADHAAELDARLAQDRIAAVAAAALSHPSVLEAARAVPELHATIGPWRN